MARASAESRAIATKSLGTGNGLVSEDHAAGQAACAAAALAWYLEQARPSLWPVRAYTILLSEM